MTGRTPGDGGSQPASSIAGDFSATPTTTVRHLSVCRGQVIADRTCQIASRITFRPRCSPAQPTCRRTPGPDRALRLAIVVVMSSGSCASPSARGQGAWQHGAPPHRAGRASVALPALPALPHDYPRPVQAEQILAFRLARSGLAARDAGGLAEAAACPASDFSRDAALLAVAARFDGLTRERYERAVDDGDLVVAHVVRGAIHALAPGDLALYGRALISRDDAELGRQLGEQVQRLAAELGFAYTDALEEVAAATKDALGGGRALGKNALHDELRERVGPDLLPWCEGCKSHHVAAMLWRYGTVKAGARLDSGRRYVLGRPGRAPAAADAVRRFLHFYGPATSKDFAEWSGVAKSHAERLWAGAGATLDEVAVQGRRAWALSDDAAALASPSQAVGVRLIPPGDPYLQKPNRPLLAPDAELRKRLFRPVASPGAVLKDGRLAGLWRVKAIGRKAEITVERFERLARADLEEEAQRISDLRRSSEPILVVAKSPTA